MSTRSLLRIILPGLLAGLALGVAPAQAGSAPQARLVHCGAQTCLRIAGHRPSADAAVTVGGRALAVEGGRDWRITVPLATARGWVGIAGQPLTVEIAGIAGERGTAREVSLPAGAFGRHVELAALIVRAH